MKSVDKHFFKEQCVTIYLFTDNVSYFDENNLFKDLSKRLTIQIYVCPPYKFPEATLMRYHLFRIYERFLCSDYLFYSDVDMKFVDDVGEEILPTDEEGITAVRHPAFFNGGWGSHGTHELSKSHVSIEKRIKYLCGGFQGGTKEAVLKAISVIDQAAERGVIHRNNAARRKGRLMKHLAAFIASPPPVKEAVSKRKKAS